MSGLNSRDRQVGRSDGARLGPAARITLLNGFRLQCRGRPVRIPVSTQRVVAFVAIHDRDLLRSYVAGVLWPDTSEDRAAANLRSALWRLGAYRLPLIHANARMLWLAPTVGVDVREMDCIASHILNSPFDETPEAAFLALSGELLPGFYDEWILTERERLRHLRLQVLETLCERWTATGQNSQAIAAGLAAIAEEPLRESAQYILIKAYLAAGNHAEAVQQFERYRKVLHTELSLEPSPQLRSELGLPNSAKPIEAPGRKTRGGGLRKPLAAAALLELIMDSWGHYLVHLTGLISPWW